MKTSLERYKGIHPGIVLERELTRRALKQRPFALAIDELPQTLNAITKGKRRLNTALALKIEEALNLEEGAFVLLQAYYDIAQEKQKHNVATPDLSKLRKALFWDTNIEKIDWNKQANAVIRRIFERGNDAEKLEITRFYGQQKVDAALRAPATKPMALYRNKH